MKWVYLLHVVPEQGWQTFFNTNDRHVVWHNSLFGLNSKDIERIQKDACKVILKDQYALKYLNFDKFDVRRNKLCLNLTFQGILLKILKSNQCFH